MSFLIGLKEHCFFVIAVNLTNIDLLASASIFHFILKAHSSSPCCNNRSLTEYCTHYRE